MIEGLQKLGFSEKQAMVYTALLELGSTTTEPLIKKVNLHRQIVYETLNQLIKQGMVTYIHINKRKLFQAAAPQRIKERVGELNKVASEVLPMLEKLQEYSLQKHEAQVFMGLGGVKSVLHDILENLKTGGTLYVIGAEGDRFYETTKYFYPAWNKEREKRKIKRKMLVYNSQYEQNKSTVSNEGHQELRLIPENLDTPATNWIYGDKVAIVIWEKEPVIILIESSAVATAYLNYFRILWKNAKNKS